MAGDGANDLMAIR